jgi:hypothetical protein
METKDTQIAIMGIQVKILEIPVGNIFYDQGIAVITNQDYLCFIEGNPVARNDYPELLNVQAEKVLNI